MPDVPGIQQSQQRVGLGVEIPVGAGSGEQRPDVGVQYRPGRAASAGNVALGLAENVGVPADEIKALRAESQQSLQWRGLRTQRRRPEHECLLHVLLVGVEQRAHQAGAAAEPAEQRPLAHAGRGGDVIHGDRSGAPFADQSAGGIEDSAAVAGGVAALSGYQER